MGRSILLRYPVTWILFDRRSPAMSQGMEAAIDRLGSQEQVSPDAMVVLLRVAS